MFLCGAAAILLLGALHYLRERPRHRINLKSYEAIQGGMSEGEVEAIFGVPDGDYSTGPVSIFCSNGRPHEDYGPPDPEGEVKGWIGNDTYVCVAFDKEGKVRSKSYADVELRNQMVLTRIRKLLGL
jgi:hypothetical protein